MKAGGIYIRHVVPEIGWAGFIRKIFESKWLLAESSLCEMILLETLSARK
jgi:hypothetical protein